MKVIGAFAEELGAAVELLMNFDADLQAQFFVIKVTSHKNGYHMIPKKISSFTSRWLNFLDHRCFAISPTV